MKGFRSVIIFFKTIFTLKTDIPLYSLLRSFFPFRLQLKNLISIQFLNIHVLHFFADHKLFSSTIKRERGEIYHERGVKQHLRASTEEEKKLLRYSFRSFNPKEVLQLKLYQLDGEIKSSPMVVGEKKSFKKDKILEMIRAHLAHYNFEKVQGIEITHTHSSVDFILNNEDASYLCLNALSESDIEFAQQLSKALGKKVDLRAVTPSLLTYSASFDQAA